MKALTIQQPWASLIIIGVKRFEYRSWKTSYRGPLLIHAGKHQPTRDDMRYAARLCAHLRVDPPAEYPQGGYIGEVDLVGEVRLVGEQFEFEHPAVGVRGPLTPSFTPGRLTAPMRAILREVRAAQPESAANPLEGWDGAGTGFILADPRPVKFIAARGKLGMFNADETEAANLAVLAPVAFAPRPRFSWKEWILRN
jgi:hypothetical protein